MNAKQAYEIISSKEISKEEKEVLLEIITKDPEYSYLYAKDLIKGK